MPAGVWLVSLRHSRRLFLVAGGLEEAVLRAEIQLPVALEERDVRLALRNRLPPRLAGHLAQVAQKRHPIG